MGQQTHIRKLIALLLIGSCLLLGCSGFGQQATPTLEVQPEIDFNPVVSATGLVVPTQWTTLSMTTAGTVEEVFVKEDQQVEAGQPLIRLKGTENLTAAVTTAELELASSQKALDDLYKYPEVRRAQAAQDVVDAKQAVEDAQERLDNLLEQSPQTDIDQAFANVVLARDRLDKIKEDFEPYENKPEDNLVRAALLSKMAQAQDQYEDLVRLYNNLVGTADELDLAQAEADLELAKAQLSKAEQDYEVLKKGPLPEEVALAEKRLENARDQQQAANAALNDLLLTTPFAGTISNLDVRTNEWVVPGQPLIVLADLSDLHVETTDLNEIDMAQVEIGDRAIVTFDALPDVAVEGTVRRIASKAAEGSGVNYTVEVELDQIPEKLRWGMTAFVDIQVSQ
jgi:multidrug efflux pump subunit AcrA (membrane-fusion protein)